MKKIIKALFIIYIAFLYLSIFHLPGIAGTHDLSYFEKILVGSHFIPFVQLGPANAVVVSLLMYVPVGILANVAFPCFYKRKVFYSFIVFVVCFREILAVTTLKGYFDVTDIILGIVSASLMYEVIRKKTYSE